MGKSAQDEGGRDQIASMTEIFFVNEGDLLPSQWDPGRGEGPSGHPKFLLFHKKSVLVIIVSYH